MSEGERFVHFYSDFPKSPDWDDAWGDRVTKLFFMDIEMDRGEIIRTLDEALLSPEEMSSNWRKLKESIPKFH